MFRRKSFQALGICWALGLRVWAASCSVEGSLLVITWFASSPSAVKVEVFLGISLNPWVKGIEIRGTERWVSIHPLMFCLNIQWLVLNSKFKNILYLWHLARFRILEEKMVIIPSSIHLCIRWGVRKSSILSKLKNWAKVKCLRKLKF